MIVELQHEIDNSGHLPPRRPQNRTRTVNLNFRVEGDDVILTAWGPVFADGGGLAAGRLSVSASALHAAATTLRETWHEAVVNCAVKVGSRRAFPYADNLDLANAPMAPSWDALTARLAAAGGTLHNLLFDQGDNTTRVIGKILTSALLADEQIIAIHSDDLHLPWSMLYAYGGDPAALESRGPWPLDGFWGYKHVVEQTVAMEWSYDSRIRSSRVVAGLNVDPGLDMQFEKSPCVEPLIAYFGEHVKISAIAVRETREQLAQSFELKSATEQIIYFACHLVMSSFSGSGILEPGLKLGDQRAVHVSEVRSWLSNKKYSPGPIVFFNGCQGGQLASEFHTSFGAVLLLAGANCLVGPQVQIPPLFAAEYARMFFDDFLARGKRIGDIVRDLARDLADRWHNPLGIAVSLYRCLDTHLEPFGYTDAEPTGV